MGGDASSSHEPVGKSATTQRTFVAIELPAACRQYVAARQAQLRELLVQQRIDRVVRWTSVDNVHLTLRFLGDTTTGQIRQIAIGLAKLAENSRPFALALQGLGSFPNNRRPSVIWLGVEGDLAALVMLQRQVEELAQQSGFSPESKAFSPHLTIGRTNRDSAQGDLRRLGELLAVESGHVATPVPFAVGEVVHMQSDLRPAGAIYSPIDRWSLQ
jgi:RNA 2',3'-cyclic 3'-phosphodiesterase